MRNSYLIIFLLGLVIQGINAAPIENNENFEEKLDYRLPNDVLPESYKIHLTPYLHDDEVKGKQKFTFDGNVLITLKTEKKGIKEIVLHVKKLVIDTSLTSLYETKNDEQEITISNVNLNSTTDKYVLTLKDELTPNTQYTLNFTYMGYLDDDMHGFYRSSYEDKDKVQRWIASTQFQTIHARRAFPCFDEPKFKATFQVSINKLAEYQAISNTKIKNKETSMDNKRDIVTFETTPKMSTYILAFLVSNFKENANEKNDFIIVARPESFSQTEYSLDIGQKLLKKLNEFVGSELSYETLGIPKMHLAGIPDFSAGAMENWGLLTYRERALLYDPNETTDMAQQSIAAVIAHEQTHMWFGDLVTCDWWGYTWLNEGFARYFQYFITNEVEQQWKMDQQFVVDQIHSVFKMDSLKNTHALNNPSVQTYEEISQMFGSISYNKGASIIRMIKHSMGENAFKAALRSYLNEMRGSNSKPENLFKHLRKEWKSPPEDIDLMEFFNSWTDQVGYPLININFDSDRKSFKITQKRFLLNGKDIAEEDKNLKYVVPFTYTTNKDKNFESFDFTYLKPKDVEKPITLTSPVDWVIGNIQQIGYYRINYDNKTWNNILKSLRNPTEIHEINRAQIVDDVLNLGRAGEMSYDLVMNILDYLETETHYLPWTAAFNGFTFLSNRITGNNRELFGKYILFLIENVYNKLKFIEKPEEETRLEIYTRPKILSWACKYGHKECIEMSRDYFEKMKQNRPVPKNIRAPVYCSAIREGSEDDYNYLIKQYEKSTVATEQVLILGALGCAKKQNIKNYFDYILSEKVRLQDKSSSMSSLYSENPIEVLELITKEWKNVVGSIKESDAANVLSGIIEYLTTKDEKKIVQDFMTSHDKDLSSSTKKILNKALDNLDSNIEFSQTHMENILLHFKTVLAPRYRLSDDIKPINYNIKLTPYILKTEVPVNRKQFEFDGDVSITLEPQNENVNKIVLHSKNLKINKISIKEEGNSNALDIKINSHNEITDLLTLSLNKPMTKKKHILKFEYVGKLEDDMFGFYKSKYYDENGAERWIASTQFQPVHARRAFPCFDEPKFKATFDVKISRHETLNATSNMMKKGESVPVGDRVEDTFLQTPEMSTYILAFLVSDFKERSNEDNDFIVIARENAYKQSEYSFNIGQELLKQLDNFTSLPYRTLGNKKMHMAAIPDFSAGAMENWGLITYRERALLYDPEETTDAVKQSIASIIAHEQAHMWFGNLVTCEWWSYTWLNEGFATYFQHEITNLVNPSWEYNKQFVVDQIHSVFNLDSTTKTHPLNDETVQSPSEIANMFDPISYNKGATIIRMIKYAMGEKAFQQAIQSYLKDKTKKTRVPADLFNHLNNAWKVENLDKEQFFKDWTNQVGYPVVTIKMSKDKKSFEIKQTQFLLKPDEKVEKLKYTIPFTFTTNEDKNFEPTRIDYLEKTEPKTIQLDKPAVWIIGNIQQIGYYRVNYETEIWHEIHHALLDKSWSGIHEINRAQIVDDLMNFGISGHVEYKDVLSILHYLKTETNYLPWTSAFNGFSTLSLRLGSENKQAFSRYILDLIEKVYNHLGFESKTDESPLDTYNRPKVLTWACKYGLKNCIDNSRKYFKNLKENNAVPVNIRAAVYCSAIREGNDDDFNYLREKYENSKVSTEQVLILNALGCTKKSELIENQFNYIINDNDKVRLQDKSAALSALLSQNIENYETIFKIIKDITKFKALDKALGKQDADILAANFMVSVSKYFTKKEQIEQLENFYTENKDKLNPKAIENLENAVKNCNYNLEWSEKNLPTILEFWKTKYADSDGGATANSFSITLIFFFLCMFFVN